MPFYDIVVNIPEIPEGELVDVPPYGSTENGSTILSANIAEEDVARFDNAHGLSITAVSDAEQKKREEARRREEEAATEAPSEPEVPQPVEEVTTPGGEE